MEIEELCRVLTDSASSATEKCQAAKQLGEIGIRAKGAVPALLRALNDRDYTAQGDCRMGSYDLDTYENYVREHAILALAKIDPETTATQVTPVIVELLKYPREVIREYGSNDSVTYVSFPKDVVEVFGVAAQQAVADVSTNPPKGIPTDVGWL